MIILEIKIMFLDFLASLSIKVWFHIGFLSVTNCTLFIFHVQRRERHFVQTQRLFQALDLQHFFCKKMRTFRPNETA